MNPKHEKVRRLYTSGLSTRQVAAKVGLSGHYVWVLCRGLTRDRSTAAQLRQPPKSKHWRSSRQAARKKMERHLGRKLLPTEDVHHKDEDYTNNRIENLEVLDEVVHAHRHNPPNPVPRWLRTERQAYMRAYLREYAKRKKGGQARAE